MNLLNMITISSHLESIVWQTLLSCVKCLLQDYVLDYQSGNVVLMEGGFFVEGRGEGLPNAQGIFVLPHVWNVYRTLTNPSLYLQEEHQVLVFQVYNHVLDKHFLNIYIFSLKTRQERSGVLRQGGKRMDKEGEGGKKMDKEGEGGKIMDKEGEGGRMREKDG